MLNWEKKCHLMKEGIMLGYKVSICGIEVDRAKIETKEKLSPITIIKGIKSFLVHQRLLKYHKIVMQVIRKRCSVCV